MTPLDLPADSIHEPLSDNPSPSKGLEKFTPLDPQQDIEGELGASEKPTPQEEVGGKQVDTISEIINSSQAVS